LSKSFGQALGELIREKRGQAGFSQLELAQEAFEDESKVRRIGDLERGHIANPQIKTIQPIIDTLNITKAELDACRNIRLSAAQLDQIPTLSRDALELLASRFEIETPHALQDAQLRTALTQKAEEYRTYRSAIDALDDRVAGVANLKGAAQDAAQRLDFDEVEALLSRVDEVETEIAADTKLTRARNALLQDKPARAFAILSAAADSFASVSAIKPAEFRTDHALLLYAHSLRYGGPGLALAAQMYRDAIAMLDPGDAAGPTAPPCWHRPSPPIAPRSPYTPRPIIRCNGLLHRITSATH
jgi:transcriptional regulator with XRE-family HTH domain